MVKRYMPLPLFIMSSVPFLFGCGQQPNIDVDVAIENGRVVFKIDHHDINGMMRFRVEDITGDPLWDVDLSYDRNTRITYGILPDEGSRPARQVHPQGQSIPSSIRGQTIKVIIQYQYDAPHPATSTFQKTIAIP